MGPGYLENPTYGPDMQEYWFYMFYCIHCILYSTVLHIQY